MQKLAQGGAGILCEEGCSVIFLEVEIRLGKIVCVQHNTCKISMLHTHKYFNRSFDHLEIVQVGADSLGPGVAASL